MASLDTGDQPSNRLDWHNVRSVREPLDLLLDDLRKTTTAGAREGALERLTAYVVRQSRPSFLSSF